MRALLSTPSFAFLLAVSLAFPAVAKADSDIRELRFSAVHDGPITFAMGAGWIGSELTKSEIAPADCRWCESVPMIDRRARESWRWRDAEHQADTLSNVLDFGALPAVMLGADALLASRHGALRKAPEDALIILEAAMAASLLNQIVKFSAGRERPFVHALATPEEKAATEHPSDNNLSFYSGHTSLAFALVGATGTVAAMRGYRQGWIVWPVGIAAAVAVGYLRIAADKHWLTDVATGAVVGGSIGVLVPLLLHPPRTGGKENGAGPVVLFAPERSGPRFAIAFVF